MPARIELVDYDPSWPKLFERERQLIEDAIGAWLIGPIEHIGSTAVPGIKAKPIIDIMAPVESLIASFEALPILATLQYEYWPYRADVMQWHCKPSDDCRTHHLHLVPLGSPRWNACIAFRDHLRTHRDAAAAYQELKEELAVRHEHDREAYTEGKTAFVSRIVALAGKVNG